MEDTFDLYKNMLIGMVAVFQIPTLPYFLGRMGLVTPRFLWGNIKYAILIIFIVAAVLTPTPDPWNQTVFAAPMIAMYLLSIGIVWLVRPKDDVPPVEGNSTNLKLVLAATVIDRARRQHARRVVPFRHGWSA